MHYYLKANIILTNISGYRIGYNVVTKSAYGVVMKLFFIAFFCLKVEVCKYKYKYK